MVSLSLLRCGGYGTLLSSPAFPFLSHDITKKKQWGKKLQMYKIYVKKNSTKYNFVPDNFMAVSLAHWLHTLSIIKMLVCTCAMHMSSMDTSSIIVHHGTVQYSRRIPISRNLKFFEITDNSNPRRGVEGVGWGGGYPFFKWRGWSKGLKFSVAGFFWLEKFGKYF